MVYQIIKRTFEALNYPEGSEERKQLNRSGLTSQYFTSYKWIIRRPFYMSDGKSLHPQVWQDDEYKTLKEAKEVARRMDYGEAVHLPYYTFTCEISKEQAIQKAKEIFNEELKMKNFPEDQWYSLAENWDLNLWTAEDETLGENCTGDYHGSIYPVINGNTNTETWIEININE